MYENALEILNIIEKMNKKAYIVGGYVRDKYLNIQSNDIDICTNMSGEQIKNVFKVLKENDFGTFIIEYKGYDFEITLFRKDYYNNTRYPKVEFISNIKEDLKRRDFTINMLCIDKFGNIIDYYNSLEDLNNKKIRCLENTKNKLEEDPLRIIRAIRFASDLEFDLDLELKENILKLKNNVSKITNKKLKEELKKVKNKERFTKLLNELDLRNIL